MAERARLAMVWASSCGGCEMALLEIGDHLLELAEVADLVFCPCLVDTKLADVEAMPDGHIDACFFNGAIRTEDDARMARLMRRKSKVLVAFGACSSSGGIPGLANASTREALLATVYTDCPTVANPERGAPAAGERLPGGDDVAALPSLLAAVGALRHVVEVDYTMPGCPPEGEQVWGVCEAILSGDLPERGALLGVGEGTVCDECPLEKRDTKIEAFRRPHEFIPDGVTCLLEQGVVCAGIATRAGCEARCPAVAMPCRGCYGASGGAEDLGLGLAGALSAYLPAGDEARTRALIAQVVDPIGTLYRFSLPGSPLGLIATSDRPAAADEEDPS